MMAEEDAPSAAAASAADQQRRRLLSRVRVGRRLSIFWPDDGAWYDGVVGAHYPNEWQGHVYRIEYDDGEAETFDLATEQFRILDGDDDIDGGDNNGGEGEEAAASAAVGASSSSSNNNNSNNTAPEISSLTVRFDGLRETWRRPPTYYGGEGFSWPDGWIEVQRAVPSEGQPAIEIETHNNHHLGNNRGSGTRWTVEFHPPSQSKGGRTKVCRSIDEAKRYIERQAAQQAKRERQDQQRSEGRSRRSGRKRATPNPTPSDPALLPPAGTPAALRRIMQRRDPLSERMRRAILVGAGLARQKRILHNDVGFLGADGQMYPNLRRAFGTHAGLKACALCKSRVQGNWFCRIVHGHWDRPDYDGGHSLKGAVEWLQGTAEELEERLWGLLPGGGKIGSGARAMNTPGGVEGEGGSMDALGEDLFCHVASFVPRLSQLVSFCGTSRRGHRLLHRSVHAERLLRGVFLRQFGETGARGTFLERDLTWRERWTAVAGLRRGLARGTVRPPGGGVWPVRSTAGVLPERDERESIFYDNPEHATPEGMTCNGYFGAAPLDLPPPPNARPGWKPPLVLTGDFNGIRIFHSPSELFFHGDGRDRFVAVGDEEGGGQVLSLIQCDRGSSSASLRNGRGANVCCFIGYMSGRVAALSATPTAKGDGYDFAIAESVHSHESEVTALAFLQLGPNADGDDPPVLFSACCAGKVYFYPTFSAEGAELAFANCYDCPIFSLASTTIRSGDRSFPLLCTGDRGGNVRLWLKQDDMRTQLPGKKFRPIHMYKSSTQRGTGHHLVTRAMFVRDDLLITGTNNGDVRFWRLQLAEDSSRAAGKGPLPGLKLRYDLMGIHNGAVELLITVGDVLLSSGGNDGKILGWDVNTGLRLGEMQCHPGTPVDAAGNVVATGGNMLRSCVVDFVMNGRDGTLISLCRDGSLTQLSFG